MGYRSSREASSDQNQVRRFGDLRFRNMFHHARRDKVVISLETVTGDLDRNKVVKVKVQHEVK